MFTVQLLWFRFGDAALVVSSFTPRACGFFSILKAVGMTPFAAVVIDSRRLTTSPQLRLLVTKHGVAGRDLTCAVFTVKPLHPKTLSHSDLGPFLIPVALIKLQLSFLYLARDEIHFAVVQFDPAQAIKSKRVRFGKQASLSGAVNIDAFHLVESVSSFVCLQDAEVEDMSKIFLVFLLRKHLCSDYKLCTTKSLLRMSFGARTLGRVNGDHCAK